MPKTFGMTCRAIDRIFYVLTLAVGLVVSLLFY